jgi:presenilin-like A22 family membrane protease
MTDHHPVAVLPKGEQWHVLAHGLLVFFVTGALALAAGARTIVRGGYAPSAAVSVPYVLALILFTTALLILALRAFKNPLVFEALFALSMLAGVWFLADLYLSPGLALAVGSVVILLRFLWKSVFMANTALVIGIAGISASLALKMSPLAMLALLTMLSFYDIVAVYRTKHMVKMFRELTSHGVVFAFILTPLSPRALLSTVPAEQRGMLLGTGDVALPVMFALSALRNGPVQAVSTLAGAALGYALLFMLFLAQPHRTPVPALPPIALGSMLAYIASLLIFPS